MKSKNILLMALTGGLLLLSACAKEEIAQEQTFYGKLTVEVTDLPDTPLLEVRCDDQQLGDAPISLPGISLKAGSKGKLSVYLKGTQEKVADTSITITRNSTVNLKVIYSDLLGIKGFLGNTSSVGADSVRLQFIYKFDSPFYSYPVLDLHILKGTEREDIGVVIKGLKSGQLNLQTVTLPHVGEDPGVIYYGILKDPVTGETVKMKYKNRDYFIIMGGDVYFNGALNLVQIIDDEGDETINRINTTVIRL